jgi:type VI secretion system secreted protein Hcp
MATDMFIKIGNIKGESKDKTYKDAIDVLAWSWGMSQSGSMHIGSGGGAGRVNVQDLSLTKYVDASTPILMQFCATGEHVDKVELHLRKAGKEQMVYLKLTLTKAIITNVSTGGSGGEDRLTENLTINFAKYKIEYFPQDDTGAAAAAIDSGYNIELNVAEA